MCSLTLFDKNLLYLQVPLLMSIYTWRTNSSNGALNESIINNIIIRRSQVNSNVTPPTIELSLSESQINRNRRDRARWNNGHIPKDRNGQTCMTLLCARRRVLTTLAEKIRDIFLEDSWWTAKNIYTDIKYFSRSESRRPFAARTRSPEHARGEESEREIYLLRDPLFPRPCIRL